MPPFAVGCRHKRVGINSKNNRKCKSIIDSAPAYKTKFLSWS